MKKGEKMKYIVVEIQTNADGTVGTLVSTFNDRNLAESQYHTVLAAAAVSTLPMHSCVLLQNDGRQLAKEFYMHVPVEG